MCKRQGFSERSGSVSIFGYDGLGNECVVSKRGPPLARSRRLDVTNEQRCMGAMT